MQDVLIQVLKEFLELLPKLATALAIFLVFWLLALLIRALLRHLVRHGDMAKQNVFRLVRQVVYVSLLLLGLVMALGTTERVDARTARKPERSLNF